MARHAHDGAEVVGHTARARVARSCLLALYKYTRCMNINDIANKATQEANVRMGRCPRRFQRQLFWWLIGGVFLINVRVAFCALLAAADLAALEKAEDARFGFNWWFQERIGEELIELGVSLKKAKLATPRTRLQHGLVAAGMPAPKRRRSSSARSLDLGALPSKHELVKAAKVVTEWDDSRNAKAHMPYQGRCLACTATAVRYARANGERGKTTLMPPTTTGEGRSKRTVRRGIPWVTTACNKCRVHLCTSCFDDVALWDHEHKCVPCATVLTG